MKKSLILGVVVLLALALGASFAFAATATPEKPMGQMMNMDQMAEMHKNMLEQKVQDGTLTPEQAKAMNDKMANMGTMMTCCSDMMGKKIMNSNDKDAMGNMASCQTTKTTEDKQNK